VDVDHSTVTKLLMVHLTTALAGSGVDLIAPGRAATQGGGGGGAIWTRIARMTLAPVERSTKSTEVDRAGLTLVMHVAVGQEAVRQNAYELGGALAAVRAALSRRKLADSPETHRIDLVSAETAEDAEPFDSRLGMTGSVTVTGFVERLS